jgi:cob(I)alamin adenosyltransferase
MVRLNKIYTRTGDGGTSGLVDGSRRAKHDARFEAIGAVDEANALLGWATLAIDEPHRPAIAMAQNNLFDLGADLATPGEAEGALRVSNGQAEALEHRIDELNEALEPLASFILPGGTEGASRLHIARTSVRRAERAMTALAAAEPVNPAALAYINRLSDYLFVLARAVNQGRDPLWVPGANR